MARCRFVSPESVRLPLSEGEWIEVKHELNAGEERRVFSGLVKSMQAGERAQLNPEQVGKTKLVEYIVRWSLCDASGAKVPFSASALDRLDTETYQEIKEAVDAHEEAVEKAREERKNVRAGETPSPATSLSAVS